MPRKYVKKKIKKYSDQELEQAIERVKRGETYYKVAKITGIPMETLRYNLVVEVKRRGSGKPTILTKEEEKDVAHVAISLAENGFPMDRKDLKLFVQSYLNAKGVKIKAWKENIPGTEWIRLFLKRHETDITSRKPELLTKQRVEALTVETVEKFFEMYEKVVRENNLSNSPERIYNLDETALNTDPRSSKVLVRRTSRTAHLKSASGGKACYTALFCCSVTGKFVCPMIIYRSTSCGLISTWTEGGPKDCLYASTEKGWIMDVVFENWLQKFATAIDTSKPTLLIVDGHNSHITYNAAKLCQQHKIILLCLPPQTTHALQPLDVGVFKGMKTMWRNVLKTWFRESRQSIVSKAIFPKLFKRLYDNLHESWATGGFKASGLYPINKMAVRKKCLDYIPESSDGDVTAIQQAVRDVIMPKMSSATQNMVASAKKRRKRVQMKYGEVLSSSESMKRLKEDEESKLKKKQGKSKRKTSQNRLLGPVTSKSAASQEISQEQIMQLTDSHIASDTDKNNKMKGITPVCAADLRIDDFVVACYNDRKYLGQIIESKNNNTFCISFLNHVKSAVYVGGLFAYPSFKDVSYVKDRDIFGRVAPPVPKHRDTFLFDVNAHLW